MTLTPLLAMSAGAAISAGLADGVMTVSRFPANGTTDPAARPRSTSVWGLLVSADRNTSAGAPCSILVASAVDESVEMITVVPGVSDSYALLTWARTALSDAAP